MTRRCWIGSPVSGSGLGKNTDAQLMLTPLGVGQLPAFPAQMSGAGNGLILPIAPTFIPSPVVIEPVIIEDIICFSVVGKVYHGNPVTFEKTEIEGASGYARICFNKKDIKRNMDNDPYGYGVFSAELDGYVLKEDLTGELTSSEESKVFTEKDIVERDIKESPAGLFLYFSGDTPRFFGIGVHEETDPFFVAGGPAWVNLDFYCACQFSAVGFIIPGGDGTYRFDTSDESGLTSEFIYAFYSDGPEYGLDCDGNPIGGGGD